MKKPTLTGPGMKVVVTVSNQFKEALNFTLNIPSPVRLEYTFIVSCAIEYIAVMKDLHPT